MALSDAAVVPFEETFLIIGGYDGTNGVYIDKVYRYTTAEGDWQEMPPSMKLSEAKSHLTAMIVPSSLFE